LLINLETSDIEKFEVIGFSSVSGLAVLVPTNKSEFFGVFVGYALKFAIFYDFLVPLP